MLEVVLAIPFWFEMLATITGAISGSMSASRAQYDLFGTMIIAIIMGLFGGILRDILLQDYGIYAFQRPELIIACVITAFIVFYFGRLTTYLNPVIDIVDGLSVGMWAIISAGKGLSAGLGIVPAVVLGTVVSIGGGVMRDIMMNKQINAFRPGSLYGTAALVGTAIFAVMKSFHILDEWSPIICLLLIMGIRFGSMAFGWHTTPAHDLTQTVSDVVAQPVRTIRYKRRTPENLADEAQRRKQAQESHPTWRERLHLR